MITKSTSRKTASFSQLINYLNQGRVAEDDYFFRHNVYSHTPYYIVKEFHENYRNLKRRVNSNALYHEIISLKYQNNLTIKEQREILKDLMNYYTNARANNNLVYGVIHEQHNQIHCHLMISSNELANDRNKRLSRKEFAEIKTELENYAYAKYPKLEREKRTNRKSRAKAKTIDNEIHLKKRTGKKSDREVMKARLQAIFAKSNKPQDFIKTLEAEKIQVYQRGKTFGFLYEPTGKKYRLKTLELEKEFAEMNAIFTQPKKEASQNPKADKELFRDRLKTIFSSSKSYNDFKASLEKEDIRMYRTEKSFGFINKETDYKYRLETLGLEREFQDLMQRMNDENKSFANRAKSFGKRFFHELINDAEHFITGKKPVMENEIWTQRNAGHRQKDYLQDVLDKKGSNRIKSEEQEKFAAQIKALSKTKSHSFTK